MIWADGNFYALACLWTTTQIRRRLEAAKANFRKHEKYFASTKRSRACCWRGAGNINAASRRATEAGLQISRIIAIVGFVLLGLQTWANFYRQWHDPVLAMKYLDIFCAEDLVEQRKKACRHFLKTKQWGIEIEDVLDVLDDLGFYVQTIHVSRDVLHQYFYWWIRGYVILADSYIAVKRAGNPDKNEPPDPTRWEHCKLLLQQVSKVEVERLKKVNALSQNVEWSDDQKMRFLKEEAED